MSSSPYPFFLKITPKTANVNLFKIDSTSHTIYKAFHYPEESSHSMITSINPSDRVLLSYSKGLKGSVMNKKFLTKDDLYQYRLNHNDAFILQFSFVFSELLSNDFISDSLLNKEAAAQNIFVFGHKRRKFIEEMLSSIIAATSDLKLSFYSYDRYTKDRILIHPCLKNVSVLSLNNIANALLNMKNEFKLSLMSKVQIPNEHKEEDSEHTVIIVANSNRRTYNFISSQLLPLSDINDLLSALHYIPSAFILNVTEHTDEDIDLAKQFHSLLTQLNKGSPQSSRNSKEIQSCKVTSDRLKASISKRNRPNPLLASCEAEENDKQPISLNEKNESSGTSNLFNDRLYQRDSYASMKNDYEFIQQQHKQIERINSKLTVELEQERREKLNCIKENGILTNQILKLKREVTSLLGSIKDMSVKEQQIVLETKQRSFLDNELRLKDDQIQALIKEKSYLEVEFQILNEKHQDLSSEYQAKQIYCEEANSNQEASMKLIEDKVYKLEAELSTFQKENLLLNQLNQKQSLQIDNLTKAKEKYYNKYKALKQKASLQSYPQQSNPINEREPIYQYQYQSQDKLIETLRSKIKQINTESIS